MTSATMNKKSATNMEANAIQIADLRFLIVEDHGFQRWAVRQILEGLGARFVFEAADGRAALELFWSLEQPIDIIISDLDMPGMDGMEFIRHVGAVGMPVSIILASALERALISSVETMTTAYGINLLGAIEKPITPAALESAIRLYAPPTANTERVKAACSHSPMMKSSRACVATNSSPTFNRR